MSDVVHLFNFVIAFERTVLAGEKPSDDLPKKDTGFSECTGLEATMEPKVIKEGGRNYGPHQRPGPVTFATVVLKRGISNDIDLFKWFSETTSRAQFTNRRDVTITLRNISGQPVLRWQLRNAMPIKFKAGDMNARGTEIGIEELHLAHEGLRINQPRKPPPIDLSELE